MLSTIKHSIFNLNKLLHIQREIILTSINKIYVKQREMVNFNAKNCPKNVNALILKIVTLCYSI